VVRSFPFWFWVGDGHRFLPFRAEEKRNLPRTGDLAEMGHSNVVPLRGKPSPDIGESLLVQSGAEDGGDKVGEVRCAVVELEPANDAVVGQVFGDAGFGDS
jgi:hypothetical protein